MRVIQSPTFSGSSAIHCAVLSEIVGAVASATVACLDLHGDRQIVTSGVEVDPVDMPISFDRDPGGLVSIEQSSPSTYEVMTLINLVHDRSERSDILSWYFFDCTFSGR